MGLFISATAFRCAEPQQVAQACRDYFLIHGVDVETVPPGAEINHETDVLVYEPKGEWMVALWPLGFGVNAGAAARAIAAEKDWLVSNIKVYDGDYWEHLAYLGLDELHSHCSRPTYWDDEADGSDWDSDPEELAEAAGVSAESLRPYLIDVEKIEAPESKAFPDDQYVLSDIWAFVDFWKRLGVTFPQPDDKPARVLRIVTAGFRDMLPV